MDGVYFRGLKVFCFILCSACCHDIFVYDMSFTSLSLTTIRVDRNELSSLEDIACCLDVDGKLDVDGNTKGSLEDIACCLDVDGRLDVDGNAAKGS